MSVGSALARFRRRERKLWNSEGILTRDTGTSFSEASGDETPGQPTTIYEGACQVRASGATGRRDAQAGEREIRIAPLKAKFPADTAALKDDRLLITSSTFDAGIVGRTFRVTDVLWDDWQVARVAMLEEVTP